MHFWTSVKHPLYHNRKYQVSLTWSTFDSHKRCSIPFSIYLQISKDYFLYIYFNVSSTAGVREIDLFVTLSHFSFINVHTTYPTLQTHNSTRIFPEVLAPAFLLLYASSPKWRYRLSSFFSLCRQRSQFSSVSQDNFYFHNLVLINHAISTTLSLL